MVITNPQQEEFYRTVARTEVYQGKYYQKYSSEKQEQILADLNRRITDSCRFNKEGQTVYPHMNGTHNYISNSTALNLLNQAIDERIRLHTRHMDSRLDAIGEKIDSKVENLEGKITQTTQILRDTHKVNQEYYERSSEENKANFEWGKKWTFRGIGLTIGTCVLGYFTGYLNGPTPPLSIEFPSVSSQNLEKTKGLSSSQTPESIKRVTNHCNNPTQIYRQPTIYVPRVKVAVDVIKDDKEPINWRKQPRFQEPRVNTLPSGPTIPMGWHQPPAPAVVPIPPIVNPNP